MYWKELKAYGDKIDLTGPIWQPKYYVFNAFSQMKAREKLDYMHNNPVRAGLVGKPVDWPYGWAQWYFFRKQAGVEIMQIM